MKDFKQKVMDVVRRIPKGSVMTYKEVAVSAGNEKAYRAVGTILSSNKDLTIPCHRVIKSDGSLGAYNGLRGKSKEVLLETEGVSLRKGKVIMESWQ